MSRRQRWLRRALLSIGAVTGGLLVAYSVLALASILQGSPKPPMLQVVVVRPIPPYPPCPPEENGSVGCISSTAGAVENLPEVVIGPYTVRLDPPKEYPHPIKEIGRPASFVTTMTIWKDGQKIVEETYAEALDPHTGTDITGDGYPDAIVHIFTWGAHCCFHTKIYSVGPTVEVIRVGRYSNCQGEFRDLDGDGIYEFLTCDDSFAYRYCPFYDSPLVRVVLRYEPGAGYVPAGPQFPEVYAEKIVAHTALAETALRGESPFPDWPWYGTPRCEVLALVLDYLYSGQIEQAWEALYHYYRHPDVEAFKAEIEAAVWGSSYFVPPSSVAVEPGEGR